MVPVVTQVVSIEELLARLTEDVGKNILRVEQGEVPFGLKVHAVDWAVDEHIWTETGSVAGHDEPVRCGKPAVVSTVGVRVPHKS